MCGIAGVLATGQGGVDAESLREVTAALTERGPDGEGYHFDGPIGLGHRRLAVIDVAGGAQPLYSANGQVAIIANGEIYNFRDLRGQLESTGHVFATRTDSEVIAHGYVEWGDDVLDRLEGQFALAIWDARDRRLVLARDRMGEKPLFYSELLDGTFVFASELRALLRYRGVSRQVDPDSLARYLLYEYVPAPRAMTLGARKVCPGEMLAVDARGVRRSFYWDLPLSDTDREMNLEAAAQQLRDELSRSVTERLVSDVPLGVFLSGGIDSSVVAALASQARDGDIDTFSIGFSDKSYDESDHARLVAEHIGSRHHERMVHAADLLELVGQLGQLLDEPTGDGSLIPTHLLCRFAREHVTVALGGDGGDELFAGYPTFAAERVAGELLDAMPRTLTSVAREAGGVFSSLLPVSGANFSLDFKLSQFVRGAVPGPIRRHQSWLGSLLPEEIQTVLSPELAEQTAGADLFDDAENRLLRCPASDRWDRLMYFYCKGYLGDDVLAKVDRASMAVSLEVRAPMLDRQVVELACRVAPQLRFSKLSGKRVLKRAVRGLIPDSIIDRPKKGFGMPIAEWLRGELREYLEDSLSKSRLDAGGLLNAAAVRTMIDEHVAGRANHRKPLWTLLAFQAWLDAL